MARLLDPSTAQAIESELGGGKPLAEAPGAQRAARGHPRGDGEHSDVRIHDDARAAELGKRLGAVAFTFGSDIFLGPNAPGLDSEEGQRTLRHELTHVEQRPAGGSYRPQRISSPSSAAEREAARAARATHISVSQGSGSAIHRQTEDGIGEEELQPGDVGMQSEDEVATTIADPGTVHRDEESEEATAGSGAATATEEAATPTEEVVAPVNPALAAIFDATVGDKIRLAIAAMSDEPPQAMSANTAVLEALGAAKPLAISYRGRDAELWNMLVSLINGLIIARNGIEPHLGILAPATRIVGNLETTAGDASAIRNVLH